MSFNKRAKDALQIAGNFKVEDFYSAPFPEDVPTIELEKISLSKLLNGDEAESERVFEICKMTGRGFFYLDMLDHAIGRQIWRSACIICQLGRHRLSTITIEEKRTFKPLTGVRVFDRG